MKKIIVYLCFFFVFVIPVFGECDERYPIYENVAYTQGNNTYGILGTCSQTSLANAMNILTGTNDFDEQFILDTCLENGICEIEEKDSAVYFFKKLWLPFYVDILNKKYPDYEFGYYFASLPSDSDLDYFVSEIDFNLDKEDFYTKAVLLASINNYAYLYNIEYSNDYIYNLDLYTHMILVVSAVRDENGEIIGFSTVDSGNEVNYIDKKQFYDVAGLSSYYLWIRPAVKEEKTGLSGAWEDITQFVCNIFSSGN